MHVGFWTEAELLTRDKPANSMAATSLQVGGWGDRGEAVGGSQPQAGGESTWNVHAWP